MSAFTATQNNDWSSNRSVVADLGIDDRGQGHGRRAAEAILVEPDQGIVPDFCQQDVAIRESTRRVDSRIC